MSVVESTNAEHDGNVNENVLESAKAQYSADKVFYMTRRMSGMPLLHRLDKGYASFDRLQCELFNKLLDKFPDPPTSVNLQIPASAAHGQAGHNKSSSGGWGSIRGIAEKFNVFNKGV